MRLGSAHVLESPSIDTKGAPLIDIPFVSSTSSFCEADVQLSSKTGITSDITIGLTSHQWHWKANANLYRLDEDGYDAQATADDAQATADVVVDVDDDAVNYSDYGKLKDEDSDEDANEMYYGGLQAEYAGAVGRSMSFNDNIYVGQSFANKAKLVSKMKLVAVKGKFTFTVYKTTKTLCVAKCRVEGCGWMLRASVKPGPTTFRVIPYFYLSKE
ncbi:hypothetical protein F2Q68_00004358 [Brassica cretica]|uniref:Transposase MuDR plant domain-containing protein n=1 Tax=Brassica cretica TaxID=69181 RepID=A0A8S9JCF3_BRACR|nr:hypothetical protein F2Q68_00004358 [Brassica cretica]